MSTDIETGHFESLLTGLAGSSVFCVYCGPASGSVLDLHFAPIQRRKRPLTNPRLSKEKQELMGTKSLFIECSWRLQRGPRVLAGSGDCKDDANTVFEALALLEDKVLRSVGFWRPAGGIDLDLDFGEGFQLMVFCDHGATDSDDYSLFVDAEVYRLSQGNRIRREADLWPS